MIEKLIWLTVGAFAIGTETYMIAGLLPAIASNFHISVGAAGQLVTAFSLAYAIGSPVLSATTGNVERRILLILSLASFAAANLLAGLATNYWTLIIARICLALTAGLFMPAAVTFASITAGSAWRGRAVALVTGGVTTAIALGAPMGTWIASHANWRTPFFAVAVIAAVATVGMMFRLPHSDLRGAVPLKERLAVLRQPVILRILGVCTLYSLAGLMPYTYLAFLLKQTGAVDATLVSMMQLVWGIGATIGIFGGGMVVDRLGAVRVATVMLCLQIPVYIRLSAIAYTGLTNATIILLAITVTFWGITVWGYWPAHQAWLISLAPKAAVVTLSLNQAAIYLGSSSGAVLGSIILGVTTPAALGWVSALIDVVAIILLWSSLRGQPRGGNAVD